MNGYVYWMRTYSGRVKRVWMRFLMHPLAIGLRPEYRVDQRDWYEF